MSSTAPAHRRFVARRSSGAFLDVAVAAVLFAGSLALLTHGGIDGGVGPSRSGVGGSMWSASCWWRARRRR
jgi:hypothetical protein